MTDGADVKAALERVTTALPAGEVRLGQIEMAEAVAEAIVTGRHLIVQAGTGTGKSLAYLVPAILSGKRVVVATATKALQDQLMRKDLPFLAQHLGKPFTAALLKGRSNYLCRQRLREVSGEGDEQLALDGLAEAASSRDLKRLTAWSKTTTTGDRADLTFEPSYRSWAAVSVSARECPGAIACPSGGECFCEQARWAAAEAQVIVVNMHLYGMHIGMGATLLPDHDLVVFDEAHQLEDVIADTSGLDLSPSTFTSVARAARGILAEPALIGDVDKAGDAIGEVLGELAGSRLRQGPTPELRDVLQLGRGRIDRLREAYRAAAPKPGSDAEARLQRATLMADSVVGAISSLDTLRPTDVCWVEGPPDQATLRVAPIDVSSYLADVLWGEVTAVLTSATIPTAVAGRLGLAPDTYTQIDVGSPFDYPANALLYCATHLPDPRHPDYEAAMIDELGALIRAAGGRTLALFTSWRAMEAAVAALRPGLDADGITVLAQGDLPKPALTEKFVTDEASSLFATMGFWQGIDVPGRSLSLVVVDKLPFPRPDEPLNQARREHARAAAFSVVDLPRASTLLAQGAGRLIRTATDRGVVAVLDPRLGSARYRWDVINALPPMRRTKDRAEVERFLKEVLVERGAQ